MAVNVPRSIVFIFLLLFLFCSPNYRTSSFSQQRELSDQILLERHNLGVLKNSSYGGLDAVEGRWLNLSGLRKNDHYAWDWLPVVQERARTQSQTILDTLPVNEGELNNSEYSNGSSSVVNPLKSVNGSLNFYQNSTGIIRGTWAQSRIGRARITDPLNLTNLASGHSYVSHDIKRNITGSSGDLYVQLGETSSDELASERGLIRGIKADMWIQDETSSGNGWQVVLFGVHYPQEGRMVLSTTSEKFAGIFALPHFALSRHSFSLARQLLNQTLNQVIGKQEDSIDPVLNPWNSSPSTPSDALFPTARCEMIVYLQQHPIQGAGTNLQEVEQELRFPTGTTLSSTPGMRFSTLIFSPDCGFVLESKGPPDYPPQEGTHLEGPKIELYLTMVKRAVLCFAIGISAQIFLLKRQMQDTSTPSTRSRISLYTIAMMATGDGFGFIGCWAVGIVIDSLFPSLIAAGFLSFLCVSFFGMRFIMDIWTVQAPERQAREREEQRRREERNAAAAARNPNTLGNTPSPPVAPVITPAGADALPFFEPVRRAPNNIATQIILPPDQDLDAAAAADIANPTDGAAAVRTTLSSARREAGALYTRFYFLFFGIILLSLHASSWPVPFRTVYCNTLAFFYFSFWTPQIYRNVMRNCRKALRWEFVVGQSVLRLLPLTYFYLYTSNVVFVKTSPPAFYVVAAWVWLQVWILISQEILGPRFFIREGWAPPAYDYHPLLRDNGGDEAGSLLPIGFSDSLHTSEPSPISPTTPISPSSAGDGSSAPPALTRQNTGASTRTTTHARRSKRNNDKKDSSNKRLFDCAICTEDIEVPVIGTNGGERGGGSGAGELSTSENVGKAAAMIFERRKYMVTPCRHIFHSGCLEGWMRYRLQCPICREDLPAL